MRFSDKTVIVTGGASGQGEQECRQLATEGAHVVIADIQDERGQKLAASLAEEGGSAEYFRLDITDPAQWTALRDKLTADGRTVTGLVNNAGIGVPGRLLEVPLETWNKAFAVNVTGAFLGMQTIAPIMPEGSSIVNIGSVASLIAHHNVAYGAAKWAIRGLNKSAAVELAKYGIRVNLIHPGHITTPINAQMPAAFYDMHMKLTPMGRSGHVSEIAHVTLFLLSDEASYITGVELPVDGGFTTHAGSKPVFDALDASGQ